MKFSTRQLAYFIFSVLLWLFTAMTARAASSRIYGTFVFTNLPIQSNTFILNGESRMWLTNVVNVTNQVTITNTIGGNVTNLYAHAVQYPFTNGVDTDSTSLTSTSVVFVAQKNKPLTISIAGTYGYVVYKTNVVRDAETVAMPFTIEPTESKTNIAGGLVDAIDGWSLKSWSETNRALQNYASKNQPQTLSNKTFRSSGLDGGAATNLSNLSGTNFNLSTGVIVSVTITFGTFGGQFSTVSNGAILNVLIDGSRMTNITGLAGAVHQLIGGYWTNGTIVSPNLLGPLISNAVIVGNTTITGAVLSLVGSGVNNHISMTATSTIAAAGALMAFARENGITNAVDSGDVLGVIAFSGYGVTGQKVGARIRAIPIETFTDATAGTALQLETTPSGATQPIVRLYINSDGTITASNDVRVAGNTIAPRITGTNYQAGIPIMPLETIISVGAGNNRIYATNAGVRITGTPGVAWTLASLAGVGIDGQSFEVYNDTGYAMTIGNEISGEATASYRIRTMSGADVVSGTNAVATFRWDGNRSRWILRTVNP